MQMKGSKLIVLGAVDGRAMVKGGGGAGHTAHLHLCEVQAAELCLSLLLVPPGLLKLLPQLTLVLGSLLTQGLQL